MDFMNALSDNADAVAQKFNIDKKYAEDLIADYNLLKNTNKITDKKVLELLYKKRIKEKMKSEDENINNSSAGLIYLSGQKDILAHNLNSVFNSRYKRAKEKYEDIVRRYNFMDGNYEREIYAGECEAKYRNSIDVDSLESWEKADLATPWLVR